MSFEIASTAFAKGAAIRFLEFYGPEIRSTLA
jgi:hypothetical protein